MCVCVYVCMCEVRRRGGVSICLSVYLPICLSVYLSICLSDYLSIVSTHLCLSAAGRGSSDRGRESCRYVYMYVCIYVRM
jgi:hypothetical protein